jgi:hypothetical protein
MMRVENCILVVEGWRRSCCVVGNLVVGEDLRCDCVLLSEDGRVKKGGEGGIYAFVACSMTPSSSLGGSKCHGDVPPQISLPRFGPFQPLSPPACIVYLNLRALVISPLSRVPTLVLGLEPSYSCRQVRCSSA